MVKQGFSRFKWKPAGYKAAQNSGAVQSRLTRHAASAVGGGNASVNAHGHTGSHFASKQVRGKFANGVVVYPTTYEGAAHAAEALGQFGG